MTQVWLLELLKGTGKLFLHPLFYYFFFLAAYLGVTRVKLERQTFNVRAKDAYFELRQLLPIGLLLGLIVSIVTVVSGTVIPFALILLVAVLTVLFSLTKQVRLLSPAYTVGLGFFLLLFVAGKDWGLPLIGKYFSQLEENIFPSIAILLGLLIMAEGIAIRKKGPKGTSPKLIKSSRGQLIGAHEAKRIWMIPVFLLIPGDALTPLFGWWPVFDWGNEAYSIMLVPFALSLQQKIQGMLPKEAVKLHGNRVIILGSLVLGFAIASYWYPLLAIGAVVLAIVGQVVIRISVRSRDESRPFYFSKKNHGVMILGVTPDSPAAKMELDVGEIITKVNGMIVNDEKSLYEAVQRNAAHCKLEVLDTNGHIRLEQCAIYEGDHHQLGVLYVQDEKEWDHDAV